MHCYVHIPFCDHICFYCDFCRVISKQKDEYLNALEREIHSLSFSNIDTLYFGGGTPSSLTIPQINKINSLFKPYLSKDYEWTIECNPDSCSLDKCMAYKEAGINRISLGVQSFDDDMLKRIGRHHTASDVYTSIHNLKEAGFDNISIDLIYGLPGQSLKDIERDLHAFMQCDVKHLSIYSLQIEENSVFGKQHIQPCDEDLEADMYEYICQTLKKNGYIHYEISSFCKEGCESRHNLCYWDDSDFTGIGCGASGRESGIRYDHTRQLKDYIQNPLKRDYIPSTREDRMFETIMMSLRTCFGMDLNAFYTKYGIDFIKTYQSVIEKYKDYFEINGNSIHVNEKGMMILNTILIDFL